MKGADWVTLYNVFYDSHGKSDICAFKYIDQGCNLLHQKQTAAKECAKNYKKCLAANDKNPTAAKMCAQSDKECLDAIVAEVKTSFAGFDTDYGNTRCMDLSDVFAGIKDKYHAFVALSDPSLVTGLKSFAHADIREPPREPEVDYSEFAEFYES